MKRLRKICNNFAAEIKILENSKCKKFLEVV